MRALPATPPSRRRSVKVSGRRRPASSSFAGDLDGVVAARDARRAEGDRAAPEHLVVDRLRDPRLLLRAQRRDAAAAVAHAQAAGVGGQLGRVVAERGRPARDLEDQIVARLGGGAAPAGAHGERGVVGTELHQSRYTAWASSPPSTPAGSAPEPWA
jgi:hypothetical protein